MKTIDRELAAADGPFEPAWEIADLFPPQGMWSADDYLALNTNRLVEFADGHIEVLPVPSDSHQAIVIFLLTRLLSFFQPQGGLVRIAPLRLQLWPGKFREPDLLCLIDSEDPRRDERFWTGADLVIEVVSPDDPNRDLVAKRDEYARAGIPEYWIVDPAAETVVVLQLAKQTTPGYVEYGTYVRGMTAASAQFENLTVSVDAVLDAP